METYTIEQLEKAEESVTRRAKEAAYKASENIIDRRTQSLVYLLAKEYIVLGARMMQEELLKIEDNEE